MSLFTRQLFRFTLCHQSSAITKRTALHQQTCTLQLVMSNIKRSLSSYTSSNVYLSTFQSSASRPSILKPKQFYMVQKMHSLQANSDVKSDDIQLVTSTDNKHKPTTYIAKLRQTAAQYGSTVMVFHVTISLISLGTCYTIIASGVDMSGIFEKIGLSENAVNKLATSSGTFAAAYLVHKVLMPIRVSITLACTPLIVRYLRKMGFIKKPLPILPRKDKK